MFALRIREKSKNGKRHARIHTKHNNTLEDREGASESERARMTARATVRVRGRERAREKEEMDM